VARRRHDTTTPPGGRSCSVAWDRLPGRITGRRTVTLFAVFLGYLRADQIIWESKQLCTRAQPGWRWCAALRRPDVSMQLYSGRSLQRMIHQAAAAWPPPLRTFWHSVLATSSAAGGVRRVRRASPPSDQRGSDILHLDSRAFCAASLARHFFGVRDGPTSRRAPAPLAREEPVEPPWRIWRRSKRAPRCSRCPPRAGPPGCVVRRAHCRGKRPPVLSTGSQQPISLTRLVPVRARSGTST
jgi:hypothetical protein